jgi:FHA domain
MRIELKVTDQSGTTQSAFDERDRDNAIVIGSGDHAVRVHGEFVNEQHASIYANQGQWWVADLNSGGGTFVNGQRLIFGAHAVQAGDVIKLGPEFDAPRITVAGVEGPTLGATPSLQPLPEFRDKIEEGVVKFIHAHEDKCDEMKKARRMQLPHPIWLAIAGVWIGGLGLVGYYKYTGKHDQKSSLINDDLVAARSGDATTEPMDVDGMVAAASFGRVSSARVVSFREAVGQIDTRSGSDRNWQKAIHTAREEPLEKSIWILKKYVASNPYSHHRKDAQELIEIGSQEWCFQQLLKELQRRNELKNAFDANPNDAKLKADLQLLDANLTKALGGERVDLETLDEAKLRQLIDPLILKAGQKKLLEALARIDKM